MCVLCIFAALITGSCSSDRHENTELAELYDRIDVEIGKSDSYQLEKEKRISALRLDLNSATGPAAREAARDHIIKEYESYISDSALLYVNQALQAARSSGDRQRQAALLIKKADITSHAGLFAGQQPLDIYFSNKYS